MEASERLFGPGGRHSERGRLWQQLGPPDFREDFARAGHRSVPMELWHYVGSDTPFLPSTFYVIFFRRNGVGPFELWSPETDGIAALLPSDEPGSSVGASPVDALADIDPELATAAVDLVPGGGASASRALLADLDGFAERMETMRVFGERVVTHATARTLMGRLSASVELDDVGVAEIIYWLRLLPGQSERLGWERSGARWRSKLTVMGRLGDGARERERWEDELWLDVSDDERERLADTAVSIRGRKLWIRDDRVLSLALLNTEASVFATVDLSEAETEPGGEQAPAGRVLSRERTPEEQDRYRLARGLALVEKGEIAAGIGELSPSDVGAHLAVARTLYASGRFDALLAQLGPLSARFRSEPDMFVLLGAAAEASGRVQASLAYYETALALSPGNAGIAEALERARARK